MNYSDHHAILQTYAHATASRLMALVSHSSNVCTSDAAHQAVTALLAQAAEKAVAEYNSLAHGVVMMTFHGTIVNDRALAPIAARLARDLSAGLCGTADAGGVEQLVCEFFKNAFGHLAKVNEPAPEKSETTG